MTIPAHKERPVVAFMASARFAEAEFINPAVKMLEDMNCAVLLPPDLYARDNQLGGTDAQRFNTFKTLWEHPEIDAIWIVRGGYGSIRICREIQELIEQSKQRKWLIGYSDVTAIHGTLSKLGICSIHGTMPVNFVKNSAASVQNIVCCLKEGRMAGLKWQAHLNNNLGRATGKLVGGNLSMLYSLQATPFAPNYKDAILFFEDLDEYLYHIDRILQNFKHSEVLNRVAGIVIGQLSDMNDNTVPWGKNAMEIVYDYTRNLRVPVAFNAPFGHVAENLPLLHGAQVSLDVSATQVTLDYLPTEE